MQTQDFYQSRRAWLYRYKYAILLAALILTIMLPGFFDEATIQSVIWPVTRTIMLLACINVIQEMPKGVVFIAVIGLLGTSFDWVQAVGSESKLSGLLSVALFSVFIFIVTYTLFVQILKTREVDIQTILAAFDGFILLGVIGSLLFTFVHYAYPNSFGNVAEGYAGINDLMYYSFVTVLTIGYGDIVPIGNAARRLSVVVGLSGQFYLVIVMSVLVGKFVAKAKSTGGLQND